MKRTVEIRCLDPQRRDALEESARLALAFVSVCSRPDRRLEWRQDKLRLTLTASALSDGCYLPESAQRLMDAATAYGIEIRRKERDGDGDPPAEWASLWETWAPSDDKTFELVLEIV